MAKHLYSHGRLQIILLLFQKAKKQLKKTPKIPPHNPLKRVLLPSILLFLSHIFLISFILPNTQKLPIYKALKEKQPKKRRGLSFHTIRKIVKKTIAV